MQKIIRIGGRLFWPLAFLSLLLGVVNHGLNPADVLIASVQTGKPFLQLLLAGAFICYVADIFRAYRNNPIIGPGATPDNNHLTALVVSPKTEIEAIAKDLIKQAAVLGDMQLKRRAERLGVIADAMKSD